MTRSLFGTCEGCRAQAVTEDGMGTPLCAACFDALPMAPDGCGAIGCEDGYTGSGVCGSCGGLGDGYPKEEMEWH